MGRLRPTGFVLGGSLQKSSGLTYRRLLRGRLVAELLLL